MHWLLARCKDYGDQAVLITPNGKYSYRELASAIAKALAEHATEDIQPNEAVAVLGTYSLDTIAHLCALIMHGAIAVPISSNVQSEIDQRLSIAACQWTIESNHISKITPSNQRPSLYHKLDNGGLVLFSSGTTGEPKAMLHDTNRLLPHYEERSAKPLSLIAFMVFDHIGGIDTLLTALSSGMTLIVPESHDPDHIAKAISDYQVKVLTASPSFLNLMLLRDSHKTYDLGCLETISYGTEPISDTLIERLKAAFPKAQLLQKYGTSETGVTRTTNQAEDSRQIQIDPQNTEYKIVDGILWLKSKTQILGYLNAPMDAFTEDGWYITGDMVEETQNGYLRVRGRKTDIINIGGEKVVPSEVEGHLEALNGVEQATVKGEQNALMGNIVIAHLSLSTSESAREFKTRMLKELTDQLEPYKIPQKVKLIDSPDSLISERFKKLRLE